MLQMRYMCLKYISPRRAPQKCRAYCQTQTDPKIPRNSSKQNLPSTFTGYDDTTIDVKSLPPDVIRRTKNIPSLHLLDKSIAKDIASLIIPHMRSHKDTFIAEMNSGTGLLTKQLLDAGVPRIHAYEKHTDFMQWLHPLVSKNPERLEVRPFNFLNIAKTGYIDKQTNGTTMDKIFHGMTRKRWDEAPAIAVIGAIPDMKFLHSVAWTFIKGYLADYGRVVIYGAVAPSISAAFVDDPNVKLFHRPKNVFLRTLFNFTKLGAVPRQAFFPWVPEKPYRKRHAQYYAEDHELIDIVKIEAKEDYFHENFTRGDAVIFYYFLFIHMRKRGTRVIPVFEKWVADCGPQLIREDYDIYTTFDELTATRLHNLFTLFKSWPEYETSPFLDFVETIMQNKEQEE